MLNSSWWSYWGSQIFTARSIVDCSSLEELGQLWAVIPEAVAWGSQADFGDTLFEVKGEFSAELNDDACSEAVTDDDNFPLWSKLLREQLAGW